MATGTFPELSDWIVNLNIYFSYLMYRNLATFTNHKFAQSDF